MHNGVGLLGAVTHNTAGPGEFETAPQHIDTIGKQGRSQGVTLQSLIGFSVKSKVDGLLKIDSAELMCVYFLRKEKIFCRGEDKGCKHTRNILVPHKAEIEELLVVSIAKTEAAYIVFMTTPFTLTFSRKPVVRKEDRL